MALHRSPQKGKLVSLMNFVEFINKFRSVRRTIWYNGSEHKELNGDHSFQIAMVAWFVNSHFGLGLSNDLLIKYALVHDLPEVWADDTPNFPDPNTPQQLSLFNKEERESHARVRIEADWGQRFPEMLEMLHGYEAKADDESRLVYSLEKLVSVINIFQDQGRTWQQLEITLENFVRFQDTRLNGHEFVRELWDELKSLLELHQTMFAEKTAA